MRLLNGAIRWGLLLGLVALGLSPYPGDGAEADAGSRQAAFVDPLALMEADVLADLLDDPQVRILDAREAKDYQAGHLPRAAHFAVSSLSGDESRIRGSLDRDTRLAVRFEQRGVGKDTHVVVYDAQGGRMAARLYWTLHYLGHPTVSVLRGGLQAWEKAGGAVTKEVVQFTRETFSLDLTPRRLADAAWILAHMHDPNVVLVDLRPADLYEKGHIPGAVNIPWTETLDADQTWWQTPDELKQIFEAAGVTKSKDVVLYAEVGAMSSLGYLMLRALGYPQVRSYDRSWAEWSSDLSLPKTGKTSPSGSVLRAIFRANGCASCHGLSNKPKVNLIGFTEAGKEAATLQNGCIRLLTKIMQIAQNDPQVMSKITDLQLRQTKTTFESHGCTKCHNADGKGATKANLNLTGLNFQSMNLGCVDMMFSLNDPAL